MTLDSSTHHRRSNRHAATIGLLVAGAFLMGSAEELVFGMLDLIATDLGVSVPTAGRLVTANALGLMLGGPLLTLLATRLDRRTVLIATIAAFVVLNLVPVLVTSYGVFLGTRIVLGSVQGLFVVAAIASATSLAPPERAGRAMAIVISGFAAASAVGMPLFTMLGQSFGWRAAFLTVVVSGLALLAALPAALSAVPSVPRHRARTRQLRLALAPRVLAVLALCVLFYAATQTALTYLVPYLTGVTGVAGTAITGFLVLYGVGSLLGSAAGGRCADVDAGQTLVAGTAALTVALLGLHVLGGHVVAMTIIVLAIGSTNAVAPALQHRVEALAGPDAPFASSLPVSAIYAGIAVGSLLGGRTIDRFDLDTVGLAGAVVATVATCVAVATRRLIRSPNPATAQHATRAVVVPPLLRNPSHARSHP